MTRLTLSMRPRRGAGGGLRSSSGQSLVEFALIVPLFLLLTCAVIDLGRFYFVQMTLQHAMREAARVAVTGYHEPDPNHPGNTLSRLDSIILAAQKAAVGLDVSTIAVCYNQAGTLICPGAGGPGDTVIITLTTNLRLITPFIGRYFGPNQTYQFTVQATFRNEPFPPSQIQ